MKPFSLLLLGLSSVSASGCAKSVAHEFPAGAAFCDGPSKNFEQGVGYPEATTTPGPTSATDIECCCACAADRDCNGWTLNAKQGGTCYLKKDAGPATAVASKTAVSGLMPTRPAPPPYKPLYPTPSGAKNVLFLAVITPTVCLCVNFVVPV